MNKVYTLHTESLCYSAGIRMTGACAIPILLKYSFWYFVHGIRETFSILAAHAFFSVVWQPECTVNIRILTSDGRSCSDRLGREWFQLSVLEEAYS